MLEYIINNKEWIFSGVGVMVLVPLLSYFSKNPKNKNESDSVVGAIEVPNYSLISLYSIIPNFILRWRFKEARVNSFIKIDVRPQGDAIRLNLGELPDCQVWLQLVNHSPFDLDIENIKGELNYNGCRIGLETKDHDHIDVSKHSSKDFILLEGVLTGEQANHCSNDNKASYTLLTPRARIGTKFGVFKKHPGDLQRLHVHIINKREA